MQISTDVMGANSGQKGYHVIKTVKAVIGALVAGGPEFPAPARYVQF